MRGCFKSLKKGEKLMEVALKEIRLYYHYLFVLFIWIVVDINPILKVNGDSIVGLSPIMISIICSIFSYLIIAIQIYRKEAINRLVLGLSLFVSVEVIASLTNMSSILYYYDNYPDSLAFAFIVGIGLLTTFCTKAGFVGALSDDKKTIRIASLKLLVVSVVGAIFSFYRAPCIFLILPLVIYDWRLRRGVQGSSSKPWKFKW